MKFWGLVPNSEDTDWRDQLPRLIQEGATAHELAVRFGKNEAYVRQVLSILWLTPAKPSVKKHQVIKELIDQGLSYVQISTKLTKDVSTIQSVCRLHGWKQHQRNEVVRSKVRHDQIRSAHAEGLDLEQTGKQIGITRERVRQIAAMIGLQFSKADRNLRFPKPPRLCSECHSELIDRSVGAKTCSGNCRRAATRKVHLTTCESQKRLSDLQPEVLRLDSEGVSMRQIGILLGVGHNEISHILVSSGKRPPGKGWHSATRQLQRRNLIIRGDKAMEMFKAGKSVEEIADTLGISQISVRHDIKKARLRAKAQESA